MHPECLVARAMSLLEFFGDGWLSGGSQKRWQPVVVTDNLITNGSRLNHARPADHAWNAESAFPVGILLAAERGHRGIGPGIHMWSVVGAVHDERVIGEAELVEQVE